MKGIVVTCALLAVALGACRKEPAPTPPQSQPVQAASQPGNTQPSPLPEPATAAALPAPPTPAQAERKVDVSVALYIDAGQKDPAAMPTAGQPATIRVTPIAPPKSQPVRELDPVMDAQLVMVTMRTDGPWWVDVQRAQKLSEPERGTHAFKTTFPLGGNHVLYFLFKPKGAAMAAVPAFIHVDGQAGEPAPLPEPTRRWTAKDGLDVQLVTAPETAEVCQPLHVGTTWVKKGKPVKLSGAPDGPAVHYLAVDTGNAGLQVALPDATTPSEALGKADAGTRAAFTFERPGLYRVVALAEVAGKVVTAPFVMAVAGQAPAGGCPK